MAGPRNLVRPYGHRSIKSLDPAQDRRKLPTLRRSAALWTVSPVPLPLLLHVRGRRAVGVALLARRKDLVDEAVLLRVRRTHVEVAVDVLVDQLLGLSGRRRQDVGDDLLGVTDLLGLDLD